LNSRIKILPGRAAKKLTSISFIVSVGLKMQTSERPAYIPVYFGAGKRKSIDCKNSLRLTDTVQGKKQFPFYFDLFHPTTAASIFIIDLHRFRRR
jgi:hypothetical protein